VMGVAPGQGLVHLDRVTLRDVDFRKVSFDTFEPLGCTFEACDFRDRYDSFVKKGARILGVSPDAAKSHAGFKAKHGLPFPLLVDEDKTICRAYGVWQEKTLYGRKFMGVVRSTFVIGPTGKIVQATRKVSVAGHAEAILEAV